MVESSVSSPCALCFCGSSSYTVVITSGERRSTTETQSSQSTHRAPNQERENHRNLWLATGNSEEPLILSSGCRHRAVAVCIPYPRYSPSSGPGAYGRNLQSLDPSKSLESFPRRADLYCLIEAGIGLYALGYDGDIPQPHRLIEHPHQARL